MIWFILGYMWLFIHRPFEVWPGLGSLHIERVYMIVTIAYWALAAEKTWIHNRLNPAFVLLWTVVLLAWLASLYRDQTSVEDYFKLVVFYVLVMSSVRDERDLKRLLRAFVVAMGLYMAHSLREYLCGRYEYRMGVARMIGVDVTMGNPNSFGATVLYGLPMVFPLWFAATKKWHRWALAGYVCLSVVCILLTGSRSAFAGLCFLALVTAALSKHRVKIALLMAAAAPVVWFSLRADLQNRFLTLIDPSYGPENAQASAEGRGQGWRDGVRLWQENSVFGVGPGGFGMATGSGMQSHHLYGQVLGELGTAGAIAFIFLVYGFLGNALECRRLCRAEAKLKPTFPVRVISSVTLTICLLLLLGFGGHNLYRYTWLWFGAFEAIALHCLRRASQVEVWATTAIGPSEAPEGTCA